MRSFFLIALTCVLLGADEFDMFDIVDEEQSSFEDENSFIDVEFKLNYQYNETLKSNKVAFVNLKKDTKEFMVDIRLVADVDEQHILLKELYYKGNFTQEQYYKLGRMNIKEGYAKGFNPTDYFKNNLSLTLSNDPKEQKDNRLGSLALSYSLFLDEFVFRTLYSPKIESEKNTFLSDKSYYGLYLDKTNAENRASVYVDYSGVKNLSSSFLLHYNDEKLNIGLNLSYIYSDFIFYFESSLKNTEELINQTTFGFTHTSEYNLVSSIEYIYNEEKESKSSVFLTTRASDALVNLDINYIMWLNPQDGSSMAQLGFEYGLSDSFQTNIATSVYIGEDSSEYGKMPNDYEVLLELKYFF